jgi:hypothetical protein
MRFIETALAALFATVAIAAPVSNTFEDFEGPSEFPEMITADKFPQPFKVCGSGKGTVEVKAVYYNLPNPVSGKDLIITTTSLVKETIYPG